MKRRIRKLIAVISSLCVMVSIMAPASATLSEEPQDNSLEAVLDRAEQNGFLYMYSDADQIFDGSRIVVGTEQDIARLKGSTKGTLLVRYQTSEESNQVIFAAGKDTQTDHYGALLANNAASCGYQRIDFPDGLFANLSDTSITGGWHTFVYSVDATDPTSKQGKTVMSFDGGVTTMFPNYASWFNQNAEINDIQFLTIGGTSGTLANSNNHTNFVGKISFVAFVPETFTQSEAAVLSSTEWPPVEIPTIDLVYSAQDITINSPSDAIELSESIVDALCGLSSASIVVKYQNTNTGVGSFVSVSDPTQVNHHFHIYQSGNQFGFELRDHDSPKYSAACRVYDGEWNTVAFKAEDGAGYKLFANGALGATLAKTEANYRFLEDMSGLTSGFIGKLNRSNDANSYPFTGTIESLEIYNAALSDEELIEKTAGTKRELNAVFSNGDATGSTFFRIPFLLASSDGSLIAGSDANFGSTGDSAENIDAAVRVKPNAASYSAMDGWQNAVVPEALHMRDYADEYGYKQKSASFIDGVIMEDTVYTNRILLLIDAFAWNGGGFQSLNVDAYGQAHGGTARSVALGDGFCTIGGQKYLLLSSTNTKSGNINMNTDRSVFNYAADIYGGKNADGRYDVYHLTGTPRAYSADGTAVDDSNLSLGGLSEYSLGENYELYKNGEALTVTQKTAKSGAAPVTVPMKIFYEDSELQVYNTSYIMQVYSNDRGQSWHTDKIITGMVKRENSHYYLTGPGHGIQLQHGEHAGRLVVPIYFQQPNGGGGLTSSACTEVIYSDDGGVTWQHGEPLPNTLGHESVVVELPNGNLQIFMRNTASSGGKCKTATSLDGGQTWIDVASTFGDNYAGTNSQLSAIAYSAPVVSAKDGQTYPAVILSMAYNKSRTDGRIYVGLLKPNGTYDNGSVKYTIDWEYKYQVTGASELFAYSSLAELSNGKVGMIYEASPTDSWADGLQYMFYSEYTIDTLIRTPLQ